MAAIRATWADFKLVKTRQVAQLIFEVPLEQADNALLVLGGVPQPDAERWVGIAPITEEAAQPPPPATDKPRRSMSELGFVMQAGILCNDPQFQKFCGCDNKIDTATHVRKQCGIGSRSELATDEDGRTRWDRLRAEFDAWTGKTFRPDDRGATCPA